MPENSNSKQGKAGGHIAPEKENLQPAPLKKDVYKKADNSLFVLKRYFIVARQFLFDAKVELKKVTWPTKKELISTTAVVIVLVILIAFFLGVVDLGLVKIIKNVIK
ncbi:MAG: preprotein translocase subunit SecE [Deltaproteobacteria bacterium]|nr:preprotein translocase subunit SecE [Deltaproteobacteria bacterium]RLB17042.1 MAG: preprotein translocase subunit SecE [Deltaproteobacteria bacterium]